MFEFDTCISGSKSPVHSCFACVPVLCPGDDFAFQGRPIGYPLVKALPAQDTQLNLRHVQPATMSGCVMEFQSLPNPPGFSRRKGFVQGCRNMAAVPEAIKLWSRVRSSSLSVTRYLFCIPGSPCGLIFGSPTRIPAFSKSINSVLTDY